MSYTVHPTELGFAIVNERTGRVHSEYFTESEALDIVDSYELVDADGEVLATSPGVEAAQALAVDYPAAESICRKGSTNHRWPLR